MNMHFFCNKKGITLYENQPLKLQKIISLTNLQDALCSPPERNICTHRQCHLKHFSTQKPSVGPHSLTLWVLSLCLNPRAPHDLPPPCHPASFLTSPSHTAAPATRLTVQESCPSSCSIPTLVHAACSLSHFLYAFQVPESTTFITKLCLTSHLSSEFLEI